MRLRARFGLCFPSGHTVADGTRSVIAIYFNLYYFYNKFLTFIM